MLFLLKLTVSSLESFKKKRKEVFFSIIQTREKKKRVISQNEDFSSLALRII